MFYIERDEVDSMLVFRVVGTLFAQENVKDKKILIRNEINIHFIRYFGGTYTVNVETDDGPTVVFTCALVDFCINFFVIDIPNDTYLAYCRLAFGTDLLRLRSRGRTCAFLGLAGP